MYFFFNDAVNYLFPIKFYFIVLILLVNQILDPSFRYTRDDEAVDDQEETGWKYIHGDVFRYPPNKSLFCAVLGSGSQLLAL